MALPLRLDQDRPRIDAALSSALAGDTLLLEIARYHVGVGDDSGSEAKRLRPALVLLVASELGGDDARALDAAVAIELVHSFSLVHDDIEDGDSERRGRETVWVRYGIAQAINAGDLLAALGGRHALRAGREEARVLVEATAEMVEGQGKDVAWEGVEVGVEDYLGMIDQKTGALLRASLDLGAIVADAPRALRTDLAAFGVDLGRAFQIRDDLEDARGGGSDLARRKATLPLSIAWERAGERDRALLLRSVGSGRDLSLEESEEVRDLLKRAGARDAAQAIARGHLDRARERLEDLPFSAEGKEALGELLAELGSLR
jgi:geranylgeranyl diphosphate synthase type I